MSGKCTLIWRTVRSVLAVGVMASALALVPAGPAAADGEETGAAEQLARDHGLSLTEATARIGRQDRALAMADEARRTLGERFGGVWVDHRQSGVILVGATGTLPVAEVDRLAAAHGLTGHVRATTVRFGQPYLESVAGRLSDQLGEANLGGPDTLEVGLRPDLNRVEIALPRDAALRPSQQKFLADARLAYGAALVETRTALRTGAQACALPYCDAPLRGGVGINSDNGVGCTAGFTAKKPDGTKWVLTAGHCLTAAGFNPWQWWWTSNANGATRPVRGAAQGWWYGGGHADHAVLSVDYGAENPQNWVYAKATSPAYTITSSAPGPALWGTYLCKSGRTSGHMCGTVLSPFQTVTYKSGVTVKGMVKATIFTCKGDSGGPVYASHKAYGITSGSTLEFGSCGSHVYFTPVSTALAELGVQLMLA